MSGLFGLLDLGAGAYRAHTAGLATVGRNLANVDTEGYSRESVDLRSELAAPRVGGVRAEGPFRAESALLAIRERLAAGSQGQADTVATALLGAEAAVSPSGAPDFVDALGAMFAGFAASSAAPLDGSMRAAVVGDAQTLAASFRRAAAAITDAQRGADVQIKGNAAQATALAHQVAEANRMLATSPDPVLADRRDLAARKLAELTGATARIDPDGMMKVTLDGGLSVVDGVRASSFTATPDAAYGGHLRLDLVDGNHVDDVTARAGGRIGGEVAARDVVLARTATEVDQLAFDVATQLDAVHRAGAGLDGVSGRDLFVAPATVAGAAAAFAVDPAIAADPRKLAGAAAGAPGGDNTTFLALAALADQPLAAGGARGFVAEGIRTLAALGADAQHAVAARELEAARADILAGDRDSLSGVSPEEETAKLAQFQRAAQAASRFISTVDDMLRDLIERL